VAEASCSCGDRQLRIAFVTYDYFPTAGGIETRTYYLASELAKRHSVTVYTGKVSERRRSEFNHEIFEVEYSKIPATRGIDFLRKIWSSFHASSFDVINIEQFGIHALIAKHRNMKLGVITAHGSDVTRASPLLRPLYRRIVRHPRVRAISVSSYMKSILMRRFEIPEARVSVIPHGVDLQLFRPVGKKQRNKFLFVGRFDWEKDPLCCIKSFKILTKDHGVSDATLDMIGDGPLLRSAKEMVEANGLAAKVRFLGKISNLDLPAFYSEAVATICPRLAGLVILESMACGTPVVAGNVDMTPEIVRPGTGYIVGVGNPHDIARVMARISREEDDVELEKMGSTCRAHCREYSWSKVARMLESAYEQGLAEVKGGASNALSSV